MTGLVSGGEMIDEAREDRSDVRLERPSEENRSLSLSSMSCEGEGRIVSAEVPGWKSTGTGKARGKEIWLSSREGDEAKSSSDSETGEWEVGRERPIPELSASIAPARE